MTKEKTGKYREDTAEQSYKLDAIKVLHGTFPEDIKEYPEYFKRQCADYIHEDGWVILISDNTGIAVQTLNKWHRRYYSLPADIGIAQNRIVFVQTGPKSITVDAKTIGHAVIAIIDNGENLNEVAALLGFSENTVNNWVNKYNNARVALSLLDEGYVVMKKDVYVYGLENATIMRRMIASNISAQHIEAERLKLAYLETEAA